MQLVEALRCDRHVAGSIPDRVIGVLHRRNSSGPIMSVGSTQHLTEMSARIISWGNKGGRCVRLTTLPTSCVARLEVLGGSISWSTKGMSSPIMGELYL